MARQGITPLLLAILALALFAGAVGFLLLPRPSTPLTLQFRPVSFSDLPGWENGADGKSLEAMRRSCRVLVKRPDGRSLHRTGLGGMAANWKPFCSDILQRDFSAVDFKAAVEAYLTPYRVTAKGTARGKFTGYFEPLLEGSFKEDDRYTVPLYAKPDDLISVDLGAFRSDLKGRRIAGRIKGNRLQPYEDRAAITAAGLSSTKPILFVDDPVKAFSLHIQGSGRVRLPDGTLQGVGYAGQNGHPYVAIGRVLVEIGALTVEQVSMQSINAWLRANPDQATDIMNRNPSFIFFRLIDSADGPFGSGGVPLVGRRSLAVDRTHLPLHVPLWLDTSHPDPADNSEDAPQIPFQQLMVAQDTGGAIRGEIRGDVFWGFGAQAEEIAGRMANTGQYWVLLPKELADGYTPVPAS